MRKLLTTVLGMMVVMSCDLMPKSSSSHDNDEENDDEQAKELATKKVSYHFEKGESEVDISVDFPTDGSPVLCNAIAEYLSEELGGTYANSLDDGQAMVDFYGEASKKELEENLAAASDDDSHSMTIKVAITREYETDKLVTFITQSFEYLGGIHGLQGLSGMTFRKSDGRRFGTSMMKNLYSENWNNLTKAGLKKYFSEYSEKDIASDSELKDYILTGDDISMIKMPASDPYITKDGITLTYQPYEISFYAAGTPTYSISPDDAKPFLNQTGKAMLGL